MRVLAAVVGIGLAVPMMAQTAPASTPAPKPPVGAIASHPETPKAKPGDVDSVEHILAALYGSISGPAGQPRDWVRLRSICVPGAELIPALADATGADVVQLKVEDYIARSSARMEDAGFFEKGVHNEVEEYGNIVQVFSTYESRHAAADATPFARGINSIELLKDGGRYWIVSIYWDSERPNNPIPAEYLPLGTDASRLNQFMSGAWVGQLEYRDFQTNERVFLPTWLTMTPTADGNGVTLSYVYDDGPTKTVREKSVLMFAKGTATLGSDRDKTSDSYSVAGVEEFRKLNRGTLVLTGPGKENDKPVDVRITITLKRNLFTFEKETKAAGGEFKFRDQYTFTRKSAPLL
jgi:hypothetical protein